MARQTAEQLGENWAEMKAAEKAAPTVAHSVAQLVDCSAAMWAPQKAVHSVDVKAAL